ncbi:urease accessory protein UreF [Pelomonas sp. SE-A7]|uniref:urease accessory protein UreF n=1 Tax=Pelomonas sp. SE-A7 TaxID=3054953 RepID=UPI00259CDC26|nr:urease accessory protein UreF [Pelomonas sp. SE-A7]MDM4766177.1 urease accessory protein UreF [Pelomonas sp. SE-A7]
MTETSLLHLLWLASPALPVGGFSYSEGLEAAIEAGVVHDETTAGIWLLNQLELVQARAELPVAAAAHYATLSLDAARLVELNDWVLLSRETAESLQQTQQMGRSLLVWMQGLMPEAEVLSLLQALTPAPAWPVVMGAATASRGAALEPALQAIAFGWAENLVQAAVRCVPLGQTAGQRLLARLVEAIPAAVAQALSVPEPLAFAPLLGVHGARHETQYSRLFRS